MSDYPLPAHHLGVEHLAVLDYVCLSTTLTLPAQTQIPVTLEADNRTGGWRVRSMFGTVGWLTSEEAAEFPDMERLRSAGMTASTTAVVDLDDVAVNIGLAPWHIARNDQPEGTVLLAGGVAAGLDTSTSWDVQSTQIEALGTASVFVQFHHIGENIVVTVDDAVLGLLGPAADYGVLAQLLAQAPIAARAYIAQGLVAVDLPGDPDNLFAPSVPALPSLFDAPLLPTTLPPAGDNVEDEVLIFDPASYLQSAAALKPASKRFFGSAAVNDDPATQTFEELFRKYNLGEATED